MESDLKFGFGFNTLSLPSPADALNNISNFSPLLSTLLPFPPDCYFPNIPQPPHLLQVAPLKTTRRSTDETSSSRGKKPQQRRETITERTRRLQKLVPWNKRMNTADMLQETFKYVKFLQAQVRALHSMPVTCSTGGGGVHGGGGGEFGVLGLLNRQQLLQVLLNSPAVQSRLYSQGVCVYSIEQVLGFMAIHSSFS